MTREEAIDELSVIYERLSHTEDCANGVYSFADGDYLEAIDMAIEALQADTVSREESEYLNKTFPNHDGEWIDITSVMNKASDYVEVVRCKDCDRGFGSPVCPIQSQGWAINTDTFFCAWGERREP